LIFDAYELKGICFFRLGQVHESIVMYNLANRVKLEAKERHQTIHTLESEGALQEIKRLKSQALETTYIKLFIEETRLVFSDAKFQRQIMRNSKSVPALLES
jgi:hypothetical protein